MNDKPKALNAEGISEPFASESVPLEEWSEGTRYGSRFRYLSDFGGASHVGVALEELAPGKESSLNHYHMLGGTGLHPRRRNDTAAGRQDLPDESR